MLEIQRPGYRKSRFSTSEIEGLTRTKRGINSKNDQNSKNNKNSKITENGLSRGWEIPKKRGRILKDQEMDCDAEDLSFASASSFSPSSSSASSFSPASFSSSSSGSSGSLGSVASTPPSINIACIVPGKVARRGDWRPLILQRYRRCIVSRIDSLECDASHIVPFNLCTGNFANWAGDPANGVLLSKNLHWTFDRLYWSLDPHDILEESELDLRKNTVRLRIVVRPTKLRLSIHGFITNSDSDSESENENYVTVRKDSVSFLRIHFAAFLSQYHKELSTRSTESIIREHLEARSEDDEDAHGPAFTILNSVYKKSQKSYLVIVRGEPLREADWYSEEEGCERWGEVFLERIAEFEEDLDRKDDPDWTP